MANLFVIRAMISVHGELGVYRNSVLIFSPINHLRISLVPAPISYNLASLRNLPVG